MATTELERGAAPIENCRTHSFRGSATCSSRAMRDSICLTLRACFSAESMLAARRILSLSGLFRIAFRTPLDDHSRCVRARASRSDFVPA